MDPTDTDTVVGFTSTGPCGGQNQRVFRKGKSIRNKKALIAAQDKLQATLETGHWAEQTCSSIQRGNLLFARILFQTSSSPEKPTADVLIL